ncbi:MAG: tetratricopeptide repeat protein [Thiogranum sp.]
MSMPPESNHAMVARLLESALQQHQGGALAAAEKLYREVLEHGAEHPRALYLLGTLKAQRGDPAEAARHLREATRLDPTFSGAWINLGNALLQLGNADEAGTCYHKAIATDPNLTDAHFGLGRALLSLRRHTEAQSHFERALTLKPDFANARYQLGKALEQQGELTEAVACYHQALQQNPRLLHINTDLGRALRTLGRLDEALNAFREIIRANPDAAGAWNNLGNVLRQLARMGEAADCYRRALTIEPEMAEAWNNLGNVLKALGQLDDAADAYRRAVELKPGFTQAHGNLLLCLNYIPACDEKQLFREHKRWAEIHATPQQAAGNHTNSPDPDRRLRIGYVSPDLRTHAVTRFFEPLFAHHDHGVVETTCYAQLIQDDDTTRRLQSLSDGWHRTVGMTHQELAEQIRNDGIDILVDLAGHTARNRLPVFGLRPAPVQVSWLGYPNTTGMSSIDYRLTDAITDPDGADTLYTEKLIRLEAGLTRYLPPADAPEPGPLPARETARVTFGSLNNLVKLNDAVISLWSRVLKRAPGSRLLLFRDMLQSGVEERIRAEFARHGINGEQLELRYEQISQCSYLSVYREIDIALDPFPWNGHVTTCEALWMGVPVITLLGPVHRGRLSASVMHQVGLEELVAENPDDYVYIAGELAGDLERLVQLHTGLRQQVAESPLCDGPGLAREVEAIYRRIWRHWCTT